MQSWAAEELKYTNLPDKRLNQRLIKIVEQASAQPEASVPQASGDWANTKATIGLLHKNALYMVTLRKSCVV